MSATEQLPPGWWIWDSPNHVSHACQPNGRCVTCGRTHKRETHTHGTDCTDPRTCRVPPEGHNPGTWDKPGCSCEVCEWIRLSS